MTPEYGRKEFSFHVAVDERGKKASAVCPICGIQVFGVLAKEVAETVTDHANVVHPMRGNA